MVKFLPGQQGAIETRWKEIAGKEVRVCLQHLSRSHETQRMARGAVSVGTARNERGNGQGKLGEGFGCAGLSLVRALRGRQLKNAQREGFLCLGQSESTSGESFAVRGGGPGTVAGAVRCSHGFGLKRDSSGGKRRRGLFAARAARGDSFS